MSPFAILELVGVTLTMDGDKEWLIRKNPDTKRRKLAKWPSLNVL
jgi:hypothetical protein